MTTVVLSHAVGDMEQWLKGGSNRKPNFDQFCESYTLLRHAEGDRVSIVCTGTDIEKMKQVLGSAAAAKAKEADTVLDPIDVYVEIPGAE